MFILPPFMGSGVRVRVKQGWRHIAHGIPGLQAMLVWSVLVVLGLAVAALFAWLLSA